MSDIINFYHVGDEFGCFSNFAPYFEIHRKYMNRYRILFQGSHGR